MKGPPLPLPTPRPPLPSRRGGAGRPAQRVPLVLLCQETGISPPRPAPPHPDRVPGPRVSGRGRGTRPQLPAWGAPTGPRAPDPAPAPRPRSRSRRCPRRRRRRPTRSSLGKLRAHVSPGAGRGRQWGGGGGERRGTHGLEVDLADGTLSGRRSGDTRPPPPDNATSRAPRRSTFSGAGGRGRGVGGSGWESPAGFRGTGLGPGWGDAGAGCGCAAARRELCGAPAQPRPPEQSRACSLHSLGNLTPLQAARFGQL